MIKKSYVIVGGPSLRTCKDGSFVDFLESFSASRSARDRLLERLDSAGLSRNRKLKPDARTTPCSAARRIFRSGIRGEGRRACKSPTALRDSRAAGSSSEPA